MSPPSHQIRPSYRQEIAMLALTTAAAFTAYLQGGVAPIAGSRMQASRVADIS
jgi:hypothetical protein